ncbi:Pentatricopeptide repeat-containing protein [Raphanus sativus]|uniref:Pentatricopeptide repeat-containing protein At4g01400, mitochondrial n=1 Tax=Raphanus sativus TaxID=3726 RepID=A0A6J0LRP2_RAPSA|nr:pentatricopeptide repeat-containing protein At4g01400, mitochondrial [Raphanus sativus]KAJ4910262.1 Pentatricopeptide repeat-containing protein [Raphanus sativus]
MIRRPIYNSSAVSRHPTSPISSFLRSLFSTYSSENNNEPIVSKRNPKSPFGSPTRVQKLIASQSDPLLAKEIFDHASQHPSFRHSQSSHLVLILKLGRSRHLNLIDDVLANHRSSGYPVTGELFTYLIKVYAEAKLPDKVFRTFYKMLEFNFTPQPKHLNRILEVLVSHRGFLHKAFELFKSARLHGVMPNTRTYNILMQAFCLNDDLSIAYKLFGKMLERDVVPDVESYRILIQGFCRKGQVNAAMELLEDMLNKGFVPDRLSYTTLLNSLCRKTQLREAYKVLCRMKLKGCNPDIVHYNTMILGFCRQGCAMDARKVLEDMSSNGCSPDSVSYRTLIVGLCGEGMFEEGKKYLQEMILNGFFPHFSVSNCLVKGFCSFGKVEEACDVVELVMKNGNALHSDTWEMIVPIICKEDDSEKLKMFIEDAMKVEIRGDTRLVDAGISLGSYLSSKLQMKRKNVRERRRL